MSGYVFRCSSIGKLMTTPVSIDPSLMTPELEAIKAKKKRTDEEKALMRDALEGTLSEGAKTYIRELAAQEIFGVEFEVSSKAMEKGIQCEADSIALLNRVRGLALVKNTERRSDGLISGECDLFDAARRRGHDLKTSWSLATFPIVEAGCFDGVYEWQMRGYMRLWDADEWEVNYAMVDTPEELCRFEPMQLHVVGHIPEHHRLTTWTVKRDQKLEALIDRKVKLARAYMAQVIDEFDRTHQPGQDQPAVAERKQPKPAPTPAQRVVSTPVPEDIFGG